MIPVSLHYQIWDDVISELEMTPVRIPFRAPTHNPDCMIYDVPDPDCVPRREHRMEYPVEYVDRSSVFSTPLDCFSERKEIFIKMSREMMANLAEAVCNEEVEFEKNRVRRSGKVRVKVDVVYDVEDNPYLSLDVSCGSGSTRTVLRVERKSTHAETLSSLPAPHDGILYLVSIREDPLPRYGSRGNLTLADMIDLIQSTGSRLEMGS